MTIYTTPLQFGYFFSLAMWIIFLYRGFVQKRLSDKMLGWVMFILAMELQDYTFGFAGINYLWDEMNGFPRGVTLLFGPIVYFYFKSQTNRSFRLDKSTWIHFVPYAIYFLYHMVFFVQGPEAVEWRQSSALDLVLFYVLMLVQWASYIFYFALCLRIYRRYKQWSLNQFSNEELIGFSWFRNFIVAMLFWLVARQVMNFIDMALQLDFYQDWWWNLALVVVTFYIGLSGFSQVQPAQINFSEQATLPEDVTVSAPTTKTTPTEEVPKGTANSALASRLETAMRQERLYLNQDLNLQQLAKQLQTNSVELSTTINQHFEMNFNDYINSLRVEEFIQLSLSKKREHLTLLSNAYDAGFSSKSTFNRAFKKQKGVSPGVFLKEHQSASENE